MPQYADDKQAMMRAYKSADVGKNGFVEFKEFVDLLILLKYYNEIGAIWQLCALSLLLQACCLRR